MIELYVYCCKLVLYKHNFQETGLLWKWNNKLPDYPFTKDTRLLIVVMVVVEAEVVMYCNAFSRNINNSSSRGSRSGASSNIKTLLRWNSRVRDESVHAHRIHLSHIFTARIVQVSNVSFGRPGNSHNYSLQSQNNLSGHDFVQLVKFIRLMGQGRR